MDKGGHNELDIRLRVAVAFAIVTIGLIWCIAEIRFLNRHIESLEEAVKYHTARIHTLEQRK